MRSTLITLSSLCALSLAAPGGLLGSLLGSIKLEINACPQLVIGTGDKTSAGTSPGYQSSNPACPNYVPPGKTMPVSSPVPAVKNETVVASTSASPPHRASSFRWPAPSSAVYMASSADTAKLINLPVPTQFINAPDTQGQSQPPNTTQNTVPATSVQSSVLPEATSKSKCTKLSPANFNQSNAPVSYSEQAFTANLVPVYSEVQALPVLTPTQLPVEWNRQPAAPVSSGVQIVPANPAPVYDAAQAAPVLAPTQLPVEWNRQPAAPVSSGAQIVPAAPEIPANAAPVYNAAQATPAPTPFEWNRQPGALIIANPSYASSPSAAMVPVVAMPTAPLNPGILMPPGWPTPVAAPAANELDFARHVDTTITLMSGESPLGVVQELRNMGFYEIDN